MVNQTNENNCVLGVVDQSCILINIERNAEDKGINAIQDNSKITGDSYIDEINQIFDTIIKMEQNTCESVYHEFLSRVKSVTN